MPRNSGCVVIEWYRRTFIKDIKDEGLWVLMDRKWRLKKEH